MVLNKSDINRITAVHSLGFHNFSGPESGEFVFYDGKTPPTEEAIQAEIVRLKEEYDAQAYSRNRQAEYPSIEECVHAILDNDNNELDTLQAKRAEIKLKYPKGG